MLKKLFNKLFNKNKYDDFYQSEEYYEIDDPLERAKELSRRKNEKIKSQHPTPVQPPIDTIDISYWKTKDKAWKEQRKENWPAIDQMIQIMTPLKKGRNVVKAYYLRGKMPNWNALRGWKENQGHLNIFTFLWLHPSWDEAVLTDLRDRFITSDLVQKDDVIAGYHGFFWSQRGLAARPQEEKNKNYIPFLGFVPYLEGHGLLLFKVLMGYGSNQQYPLLNPDCNPNPYLYTLPKIDFSDIYDMGIFLTLKKMHPINEDFLLQYDEVIEYWHETAKDINYFKVEKNLLKRSSFEEALYCIHHFDTKKEGDTIRTRFAFKIRKLLDEREFAPEFKQMWSDIKSGDIVVEDAWSD